MIKDIKYSKDFCYKSLPMLLSRVSFFFHETIIIFEWRGDGWGTLHDTTKISHGQRMVKKIPRSLRRVASNDFFFRFIGRCFWQKLFCYSRPCHLFSTSPLVYKLGLGFLSRGEINTVVCHACRIKKIERLDSLITINRNYWKRINLCLQMRKDCFILFSI